MLTLRSEHLVKTYGRRTVVNDVSVHVSQGEIVGLLGPNGAGKTTSFYQIVGLIPPDSGKVFLGDKDITDLPMYKRAQAGVGYLPQEASVFRNLSVEDNVAAVLEMTNLSKREQKDKLELLLAEFGLNRVRKSMGNVLSGGERRRTEIARALATDPKFILLDEPFAGIDPIAVEDIQRIVVKLKERNIGVLITDHNVQETLSITDRAYLLYEGKILKAGNAEELANDEQVRKVYLGEHFVLHRKNYASTGEKKASDLVTSDSLIRYTNSLLISTERMAKIVSDTTEQVKNSIVNAGLQEYIISLQEFKTMLRNYAEANNDRVLADKVDALKVIEMPSKLGLMVEVVPISHYAGLINVFRAGNKYANYFLDTKSLLQQIANQLKISGAYLN